MKKILITGTSSGFGKSLLKNLSKDFFIIAVARRVKEIKKIYEKNNNI